MTWDTYFSLMQDAFNAGWDAHENFEEEPKESPVQKWLQETNSVEKKSMHAYHVRKLMELTDGHSLSVQASAGHYCNPKDSAAEDYASVEVYNVSAEDFDFFTDDPDDEGPFGWVPVSKLDLYVLKHGGIKDA